MGSGGEADPSHARLYRGSVFGTTSCRGASISTEHAGAGLAPGLPF